MRTAPRFGFLTGICALALAGSAAAQVDEAQLRTELNEALARPAGERFSKANYDRLTAFLERHADTGLGAMGYAKAIHAYLGRDYDGAAAALDEFFASHETIADAEHELIAGRIYLNGFMRGMRADDPDIEALARTGERVARLYPDARLFCRSVAPGIEAMTDAGHRRKVRLGFARGVLRSTLSEADQEEVLATLFGTRAAIPRAASAPATPVRAAPARADAQKAATVADAKRKALTGTTAPALNAELVLDDGSRPPAELSLLTAHRGKVVLLDFFATWCPPCRKALPGLQELAAEHAEVELIGATRFYGYGTDFTKGRESGEMRRGLDRDAEVAVNQTFRRVFEVDYPVAFLPSDRARDEYGVRGIPTVFVIGRDGKVVGHVVGATDASHEELKRLVATALEQK